MNKHTPGQWIVEPEEILAGTYVEPTVIVHNEDSGEIFEIATIRIGLPGTEANARLIAAAPDLLEACRHILSKLQINGDWDDGCFYYNSKSASELQSPIHQLQSAIKKAEGGE